MSKKRNPPKFKKVTKKVKLKKIKKKKFIKLNVMGRKFRIRRKKWDDMKKLPLSESQLFKTLDLMEKDGDIDRKAEWHFDSGNEWFFCEKYAERTCSPICVRRTLIQINLYKKCEGCKIGKGFLSSCIGYGFKEDDKVCNKCRIQNSCKRIYIEVNQKKQLKQDKKRLKKHERRTL